jgi:hypothetical protein
MGKSKNSSLNYEQFSVYLSRYAHPVEYLKHDPVTENLNIIITIPCYNEPDLLKTLKSIDDCYPTRSPVESIILINQPVNSNNRISYQNEKSYIETQSWIKKHSTANKKYHVIWIKDIPEKHAGVGLARKIVMDEAIRRFFRAKVFNGVIAGLDADTQCDPDYLLEIENHFQKYLNASGANIYFEHPLKINSREKHSLGIASYELHLRYLIHALRYAQFPYAFHTLGSSMTVRANIYAKQGGMNKRQAGEDFYFLHKVIPLGNFGELNTTRVIPSGRISNRVPFGTGKAMMNWSKSNLDHFDTYNPDIFEIMRTLLIGIDDLFNADDSSIEKYYDQQSTSLNGFIEAQEWLGKIRNINKQSSSLETFRYRFFHWMNALKILKLVHYLRDNRYNNVPVMDAFSWLTEKINIDKDCVDEYDALRKLRTYDRENPYYYNR